MACLRLALYLPLTTLFGIDRSKAAGLAREIARVFPVAEESLRPAVEEIRRGSEEIRRGAEPLAAPVPDPGDWPESRAAMARAIAASCTPDREDRCFPGDIAEFATATGGQSFAYGAAGVLYALHETGAPRCEPAEEWLLRQAKAPASGSPLGFYDGLTGIAWTLHRTGRTAEAADLIRIVLDQPLEGLTPGLHSGYAGIGLALDDLARTASATEAPALAAAAGRATALAVRALVDGPPSPRTGFLHGATGVALLLVRRYETTGDPALLDLAAAALRRDLDRCRAGDDGELLVVEGKRLMPYLGAGSAGIAAVIDAYLAHRPDPDLEAKGRALLPAALSAFYVQPGLLRGSAGLLMHLAATPLCDEETRQRAVRLHTRLLAGHALAYEGGLAFAGEQLMRMSMDLATGTAGCLLALGGALDTAPGPPTTLPFLAAAPRAAHPGRASGPTDRLLQES
ncbi:Protein kinase/lanthionine synthetase C family protein OS=Streptomyces cyaneofuscatus OX=66883 GN=G3I52_23500 PE=4 SV=1 [Streptomyces cyaneofuscatus]